ncbi:MAG: DUF1559 domain-containing protein [Fimbriiglobus sp.]
MPQNRDGERDDEFERPRRRRREDDDRDEPRERPKNNTVKILLIVGSIVGILFVVCGGGLVYAIFYTKSKVQEAAERTAAQNNMKRIVVAMHNDNDTFGGWRLPLAGFSRPPSTENSYRVHLLMFIEEDVLYRKFDLSQPWDSQRNLPYSSMMIKLYHDPMHQNTMNTNLTPYRFFVGPDALFQSNEKMVKVQDIPDGTSNTILFVQASETVPWAKSQELAYSKTTPLPKLGVPGKGGFNVAMADGSVRFVRDSISEADLRGLIEPADGQRPTDW